MSKVDAEEFLHRITVIDSVLYACVRKVEPILHEIHAQHGFNANRLATAFAFWIDFFDDTDPLIPRDNLIHSVQKIFAFGAMATVRIFQIGKGGLLRHDIHSCVKSKA